MVKAHLTHYRYSSNGILLVAGAIRDSSRLVLVLESEIELKPVRVKATQYHRKGRPGSAKRPS